MPFYQFHIDQGHSYGGWRYRYSTSMDPAKEGWVYDGVVFRVFREKKPETVPVIQYHILQSDGKRYHYSTTFRPLDEGWIEDGPVFNAYIGNI